MKDKTRLQVNEIRILKLIVENSKTDKKWNTDVRKNETFFIQTIKKIGTNRYPTYMEWIQSDFWHFKNYKL